MYRSLIRQQCEHQVEVLQNRLSAVYTAPELSSLLLKNRPGYLEKRHGEVLHVAKCAPRVVKVRESSKRWNKLPVEADGEELFLAPGSRILLEKGEQIDCSRLTPTVFEITEHYIWFSPDADLSVKPVVLEANVLTSFLFREIRNLGEAGIYSKVQIKAARESLLFSSERAAVENILVRKLEGKETDTVGLSSLNLFLAEATRWKPEGGRLTTELCMLS